MNPLHSHLRLMLGIALTLLTTTLLVIATAAPARAAEICTNDSAGVDDVAGQSDLTRYCIDDAGLPNSLVVKWNWDDTSWSGNNTGDACSLYDTNNNGRADFAFCVTVGGNPAQQQGNSPRLYSCTDTRPDRCTGSTQIFTFQSTCSVSIQNTQPFPSGSNTPFDTEARCTVVLAEMGGSSAALVDICSYPSQVPNSNPSDCIAYRSNTGRLEVRKVLQPTTDSGRFNLRIDGSTTGTSSGVGHGGTTGEVVVTAGNHTVDEITATGTSLADYSTAIACRDANGTGSLVASASTAGPLTVAVADGADIVCIITNQKKARIVVDKVTIPGQASTQFGFLLTGGPALSVNQSFSLTDLSPPYDTGFTLAPGTYSVAEQSIPSGWALSSAGCTSDQGGANTNPGTLTLVAGETVTCTFTNQQTPNSSITIRKVTDPATSGPSFAFTATNLSSSAFALGNGNSQQFSSLSPGSYTVAETIPTGWQLKQIECTGALNSTVQIGADADFDPGDTRVNIDLAFNENVVCTFFNDPLPSLMVAKSVTPTSVLETGEPVGFTIVVTNTGLEPLATLALSDPFFGVGNLVGTVCPALASPLPAGGVYSCVLNRFLAGDAGGNGHTNTVTVTGSDDEGNTALAIATATVTFLDVLPDISVTKSAQPSSVVEPGGLVTFTVVVTNNGLEPVTLTALNDPFLGGSLNGQGSCSLPQPLAANDEATGGPDTYTCSITARVAGNFGGPPHQNTVTAQALDDDGNQASAQATATVAIVDVPSSLAVLKLPDVASVVEPGGNVNYTVWITNTSATDAVTITQVIDDQFGVIACPGLPAMLVPGASFDCPFTGTVVGNAGLIHTNVVTVVGTDDDGVTLTNQDGHSVVVVANAVSELIVSKEASSATLAEPGGLLNFTLTLTNVSGADVITVTSLIDNVYGDVTSIHAPTLTATSCVTSQVLNPGADYSCSFTALVAGNAGFVHENVLVANGVDDDGDGVTGFNDTSVTLTDVASSLAVSKNASPTSVPESGAEVAFVVIVTNTSPVDAVTIQQVEDSLFGNLAGQCVPALPATLAPGATLICPFVRFLQDNYGANHTNTVTVAGFDDDNQPVAGTATLTIPFTDTPAALEVLKTASVITLPESGELVDFTVIVHNSSPADSITVTTVQDSFFGDVSASCLPALPVVLIPNYETRCSFARFVADNAGLSHRNVVTATGFDDDGGNLVTASDDATIAFTDLPAALSVSKTAIPTGAPGVEGVVTFTVHVQNDSLIDQVLLTSLVDSVYGNVATANSLLQDSTCLVPQTLVAGGDYTCAFSAVIVGQTGDLHANVITASGVDDDGELVSATDNALVLIADPALLTTKRDSLVQDANNDGIAGPGDILRYTVLIQNVGHAPALAVHFEDNPGLYLSLVTGSVTTSQGTVAVGNQAGDTQIIVQGGSVAPDETVTVIFDAKIADPLPAGLHGVANQGHVRGSNFPAKVTDDPDTPTPQDPTVTPVIATPLLAASKQALLAVDADHDGVPSPGDTLRYQITVVNSGNQAATAVNFTDHLDANTTLVAGSVTVSQGNVVSGNNNGDSTVLVAVGDVPALGGAVQVTYLARIATQLMGAIATVRNQGVVTSHELPALLTDDPATLALHDPTVVPLRRVPRLIATKVDLLVEDADGNGTASPGDTLLYTVVIDNHGTADATQVLFTDTVDANTTLVPGSVQVSQGVLLRGNEAGDTTIEANLGTLAAQGGEASLSFLVRINDSLLPDVSQIVNQGSVQSAEGVRVLTNDPRLLGQTNPTVISLHLAPALKLSKRAVLFTDANGDKSVSPGDTLLYTLRLVNLGTAAAANVILLDQPDSQTTLVAGSVQVLGRSVEQGNSPGDSSVRINVGLLPAHTELDISFQARISQNASGQIANQAYATYIHAAAPGELLTVFSDNPDTGEAQDPTVILIHVPTSLDEDDEPAAVQRSIFLPTVMR